MRKRGPYPRIPPSRFWVDIRTLFQTESKQPANELDDTPGRPPSAGRRREHTSLVNPRWALRPVAYRTTVPSDVSRQNRGSTTVRLARGGPVSQMP